MPVVNCIFDGGQGVFCNSNRMVLMSELLPWLDSIGDEAALTKERDLALRIVSAMRLVIWYVTHNILEEATTQLADAKDELEETKTELLEAQRDRIAMLAATMPEPPKKKPQPE
jgi:hypothetical protein